jgi:hypothetical protein
VASVVEVVLHGAADGVAGATGTWTVSRCDGGDDRRRPDDRELLLDTWRMCVPNEVAAEYERDGFTS